MNLITDIGNTRVKLAVFNERTLVHKVVLEKHLMTVDYLRDLDQEYPTDHCILTHSGKPDDSVLHYLRNRGNFLLLDSDTAVPVSNAYQTPNTLGKDRLSAVVAARFLFPETNCLVIDCGTCITCNFIDSSGTFQGGSISPGMQMRFRAMHEFTAKLPLVQPLLGDDFIGKNTEESIRIGAQTAAVFEIDAFINAYSQRFGQITTLITGGDAHYFALHLKNKIFAEENLVLIGLNEILNYNRNAR